MYKWFMAWRYLHTKVIAIFAVLGVTLCVAMVLVVTSVMGGFLDTIKARSRGLLSDIVLDAGTLQGWPYYDEFAARLARDMPEVVEVATPVIRNYGIFRVPATSYTKPTQVVGIRLDEFSRVNDFAKGLHYERFYPGTTHLGSAGQPIGQILSDGTMRLPSDHVEANELWRARATPEEIADYDADPFEIAPFPGERVFEVWGDPPGSIGAERPGVIVGCDLLNERKPDGGFTRAYPRGMEVALALLPLSRRGNVVSDLGSTLALRYMDDSRTGVYDVDSMVVYVDFDLLQHQLAMDAQELIDGSHTRPRTYQLLIALKPGVRLNAGRERIERAWREFLDSPDLRPDPDDARLLQFVEVQTWEDMQRQFIAAVEKEKVLVTFLFGLISVVAVVLIGCIFYMIVQKKTRDIGVLKALGASGPGIAGLFIVYAATVGVVGSLLGTTIGAAFVWKINEIQDFLISINPQLRVWDPSVYTFDRIPNVVKSVNVMTIGIVAVLASMAGSVIPATLAGRVWPVEALRYE
jgi:lipoprotein-releasing system permease protein